MEASRRKLRARRLEGARSRRRIRRAGASQHREQDGDRVGDLDPRTRRRLGTLGLEVRGQVAQEDALHRVLEEADAGVGPDQ